MYKRTKEKVLKDLLLIPRTFPLHLKAGGALVPIPNMPLGSSS